MFPIPGLYLAGQNAMAPGVLGSILGSFEAVRRIVGQERFAAEIKAMRLRKKIPGMRGFCVTSRHLWSHSGDQVIR